MGRRSGELRTPRGFYSERVGRKNTPIIGRKSFPTMRRAFD
jgi:hypothetical protein